jgi:GNAT superfamily N-acetyltransferase
LIRTADSVQPEPVSSDSRAGTQAPRSELIAGPRYLALVTTLLQQMRLRHPTGGIWEAADLQWWSRDDRPPALDGQLFWFDERSEPLAAVLRHDFHGGTQYDIFVLPDDPDFARSIWQAAISRTATTREQAEFTVRLDDAIGIAELSAAGLSSTDDRAVVTCWMDAGDRPAIPPLADGYELVTRADAPDRPHPMIPRNGPHVEQRLRQCSLYRPELDLSVIAPDGQTAGYGLFWPDPVTRVGLVEPMRTEQAHERRGIASHLLAEGLARLAAHGCTRLKVCNDIAIYLRAGFHPFSAATAATYSRP